MTTPRERPILMSAPMIRAIIAGDKTMTRRVVMPQPPEGTSRVVVETFAPAVTNRRGEMVPGPAHFGAHDGEGDWGTRCPYGEPGERLWVREAFSLPWAGVNGPPPTEYPEDAPVWFWADGNPPRGDWTRPKPSIHMPRWASRLTLEVTAIRVERVQAASDADIAAEGVTAEVAQDLWSQSTIAERREVVGVLPEIDCYGKHPSGYTGRDYSRDERLNLSGPVAQWRAVWTLINGAESWRANPWCWVISFRRLP